MLVTDRDPKVKQVTRLVRHPVTCLLKGNNPPDKTPSNETPALFHINANTYSIHRKPSIFLKIKFT